MKRAPRSTRSALVVAEAAQSRVVEALTIAGAQHLARCVQRCQKARLSRQGGRVSWPWRCRAVGCWACRRATMRRWWYGLRQWIDAGDFPVVLARLPIQRRGADLQAAVARLRRALRDVRDRTARLHQRWRAVAMAGMASGDGTALVLIRHHGIARHEIIATLRRRWYEIAATDVGSVEPSSSMPLKDVVDLAMARRGHEGHQQSIAAGECRNERACRIDARHIGPHSSHTCRTHLARGQQSNGRTTRLHAARGRMQRPYSARPWSGVRRRIPRAPSLVQGALRRHFHR